MKTFTTQILALAFLISCGKASDSSSPAAVAAANPIGVWKSTCLASATAGWYQVVTLSYTDSTSIETLDQYYDSACSTLRISDKSTRSYTLGNLLANGGTEINFTIAKIERTYKNASNVTSANSDRGFGSSDWTIDVAKEVTGLKYNANQNAMRSKGDQLFYIFKAADGVYTGADLATGDGTSAAKRPTALSAVTLKKQ